MKKMKYLFFAATLFVVAATSCSKDDHSRLEKPTVEKTEKALGRDVITFLNSYYSQSYQFGQSVITKENNMTYSVTEVKVGTDARGYVAVDDASGAFLYFVDVDRQNYVMTTVEIGSNQTTQYQNIDRNPNYKSTHEFDFIYVVNDANQSSISGRRFWGWSDWEANGPCINGQEPSHRTHYVFWMENYHDYGFQPC